MSWTEIIVLSICLAVPLAVISLFAIYKKIKMKKAVNPKEEKRVRGFKKTNEKKFRRGKKT